MGVRALRARLNHWQRIRGRCSALQAVACSVVSPTRPRRQRPTRTRPTEESRLKRDGIYLLFFIELLAPVLMGLSPYLISGIRLIIAQLQPAGQAFFNRPFQQGRDPVNAVGKFSVRQGRK